MRKLIALFSTLIVVSAGLFTGCTEEKVPTNQEILDKENILGVWANVTFSDNTSGLNQSTMLVYNFTESKFNYSAYYILTVNGNTKRYFSYEEGIYELTEGKLILINATKVPPLNYIYYYEFNTNYTTLSLTNSSGFYLMFWKL